MIIFLIACGVLLLFWVQSTAIHNYRMHRFVSDYAAQVCNAFHKGWPIEDSYAHANYFFQRTHPKLFNYFSQSNRFRSEAIKRVNLICTERYRVGAGDLPPAMHL